MPRHVKHNDESDIPSSPLPCSVGWQQGTGSALAHGERITQRQAPQEGGLTLRLVHSGPRCLFPMQDTFTPAQGYLSVIPLGHHLKVKSGQVWGRGLRVIY